MFLFHQFVLWGWHSFTGDNVFQMSKKEDHWVCKDMVAIKDDDDKQACGFHKTKEQYSDAQLWTLLKKYNRQKTLMSASIGKMDYRKTDGPGGEQLLKAEGFVAGHAYSIIQAREGPPSGSSSCATRGARSSGRGSGWTTTNNASLDIREDDGSCGIVKGFCCGCTKFWLCCHGLRNLYGHQSTEETLNTKEGFLEPLLP